MFLSRMLSNCRCLKLPLIVGLLSLAPNFAFCQEPQQPIEKAVEPTPETNEKTEEKSPDRFKIDKDRAIFERIEDEQPVRSEAINIDEYIAYNEVLTHAHQFSALDLQAAARRDLTFKDLFNPVRKEFKLELIYMEGRLQRLRSIGPTRMLKEAGINELYEGWMFPKDQPNPICILFTELPEGLKPQQDIKKDKLDRWVGFPGYSFKLIRYESSEINLKDPQRGVIRRAPLLMGHSPIILGNRNDPMGQMWHNTFLPVMLVGIGLLAICVIGLSFWYRRGDQYFKEAVAARQEQNPF